MKIILHQNVKLILGLRLLHLLSESGPSVLHQNGSDHDDDYTQDYLPCIPLYFC